MIAQHRDLRSRTSRREETLGDEKARNNPTKRPPAVAASSFRPLGGIALASLLPAPWVRAASTVKIGYVGPRTGLAVFAEPDAYTLAQVKRAGRRLRIGGK
ncbi:MAG: hypothetical protein IPO57_14785 [Rhodocyclales bacterium]|nr:hypothetical protein [Rhodocyclales bacterium]